MTFARNGLYINNKYEQSGVLMEENMQKSQKPNDVKWQEFLDYCKERGLRPCELSSLNKFKAEVGVGA